LCDDKVVCRVVLRHGDLFKSPNTWARMADGASPFCAPQPADIAFHRTMATQANGRTFELLESREDDALMIHAAHASAYHWALAGTSLNCARAEYLCSRAYAFAGPGAEALRHARRCAELLADAPEVQDFDRAYAREATARALACTGDAVTAATELAVARAVVVNDPEDRAIVEADLAAEPWYGVR
jgi:hypothetical protein